MNIFDISIVDNNPPTKEYLEAQRNIINSKNFYYKKINTGLAFAYYLLALIGLFTLFTLYNNGTINENEAIITFASASLGIAGVLSSNSKYVLFTAISFYSLVLIGMLILIFLYNNDVISVNKATIIFISIVLVGVKVRRNSNVLLVMISLFVAAITSINILIFTTTSIIFAAISIKLLTLIKKQIQTLDQAFLDFSEFNLDDSEFNEEYIYFCDLCNSDNFLRKYLNNIKKLGRNPTIGEWQAVRDWTVTQRILKQD